MSDIPQMISMSLSMSEDGMCTHDLFESIGGEPTIPRRKLFPLLKLMTRNGILTKGSGTDSRGKLGFKWSLSN